MTRTRTFCHRVKLGKRMTARKLQSLMPEELRKYVDRMHDRFDQWEARLPIDIMLAKSRDYAPRN